MAAKNQQPFGSRPGPKITEAKSPVVPDLPGEPAPGASGVEPVSPLLDNGIAPHGTPGQTPARPVFGHRSATPLPSAGLAKHGTPKSVGDGAKKGGNK